MYFWMITLRLPLLDSGNLVKISVKIYYLDFTTFMPQPRLLFSPGLHIHIFLLYF